MFKGERIISTPEAMILVGIVFIIYCVGLAFDLVTWGVAGIVFDILTYALLFAWFTFRGISIQRPGMYATMLIDAIPFVNMLPIWIPYVIFVAATARHATEGSEDEQAVGAGDMDEFDAAEAA
jgi:hypothetical protein